MTSDDSLRQLDSHFQFGENWAAYAATVTEDQIRDAIASLEDLLPAGQVEGRSFLDFGCGSGIHALAAHRLGARPVVAMDIDPASVATANALLERFGSDTGWEVLEGSVFDPPLQQRTFDIVYSWGVLHHTGAMREAIDQAARQVTDGGTLVIAIYLRTPFCAAWTRIKRAYTAMPTLLRHPVTWLYSALCILRMLARGTNPLRAIRGYRSRRGMSWYHDRIDWLGGYPYESASPEEVSAFLEPRGFRLVRALDTAPTIGLLGSGCAQYVFEHQAPVD